MRNLLFELVVLNVTQYFTCQLFLAVARWACLHIHEKVILLYTTCRLWPISTACWHQVYCLIWIPISLHLNEDLILPGVHASDVCLMTLQRYIVSLALMFLYPWTQLLLIILRGCSIWRVEFVLKNGLLKPSNKQVICLVFMVFEYF